MDDKPIVHKLLMQFLPGLYLTFPFVLLSRGVKILHTGTLLVHKGLTSRLAQILAGFEQRWGLVSNVVFGGDRPHF